MQIMPYARLQHRTDAMSYAKYSHENRVVVKGSHMVDFLKKLIHWSCKMPHRWVPVVIFSLYA